MVSENRKIPHAIANAKGLRDEDRHTIYDLYALYEDKLTRNVLRDRYYNMKQRPQDLGISTPPKLRNLEQVVGWCAKSVNCLADRSIFDGFVAQSEDTLTQLQQMTQRTNLKRKYRKAVISELKHSCSFVTVTKDEDQKAVISVYPATASSALWSDRLERITAGMVVVDRDNTLHRRGIPTWVDVFTDDAIIEIRFIDRQWVAFYHEHDMGRCLMEALVYGASLDRPFGKSRISRAVMNITDSAMRASVRSEISAEFFTSPQKYLLGADKEALEGQTKWDAYIGNIFCVSRRDDDVIPQFGQLSQATMQPHLDYIRALAMRFSGETNVPICELGVSYDNPTSSDAINAQHEPLVIEAQNLNADNGYALSNVAIMALATEANKDFKTMREECLDVHPKFRNPSMPSPISQGDNLVKMSSALPFYAMSDVALEHSGFEDDDQQRLRVDRRRYQAQELATARFNEMSKAGTNGNAESTSAV
jgi:hypothetical protein